jgi:hypothetical protein
MTQHRMQLLVPPRTVTWYPAGEDCSDSVDGDLFLIDHGTLADDAIELGQEALTVTQPELKGYTWCAHTAFRRGQIAGADALGEMGFKGYERRTVAGYKHHLYAKVHFDASEEQCATAVEFDESCEGLEYGWTEYPTLALDGLTEAKLACTWGDAIICSTKETIVLMGLGLFPDRPPAMVVPARMALWIGAAVINGVPTTTA